MFRVKGSIGNWTADTLTLAGGPNGTLAVKTDNSAATYYWFNEPKDRIWTGDLV